MVLFFLVGVNLVPNDFVCVYAAHGSGHICCCC